MHVFVIYKKNEPNSCFAALLTNMFLAIVTSYYALLLNIICQSAKLELSVIQCNLRNEQNRLKVNFISVEKKD